MDKATGDFICITDAPRDKVAHALVEQARLDMQICMAEIEGASKLAFAKVQGARNASVIREAVEVAVADLCAARNDFFAKYDASMQLFQTAREVSGEFDEGEGKE